jgi:glycosyltransferase involved in cell wall biosynthesis
MSTANPTSDASDNATAAPRRIGIVSSVDVSCGNAAFTRVLADTIAAVPGVEVELLSLDLELTQSSGTSERRLADAHIDELCRRMRTLDAVNIQFEQGLYGAHPADVLRRLERLLDANPNAYVTFHAVRTIDHTKILPEHILARLSELQFRTAFKMLKTYAASQQQTRMSRRFVEAVCSRNRWIIVHTERSARRIRTLFPQAKVAVHALCIVPPGVRRTSPVIERLRARLGLGPGAKIIGMFGYLGGYKGLDTAIDAMTLLPTEYHLCIFGRQHPQSIKQGERIGTSVAAPVHQIQHLGLTKRVHFVGELSDDDFVAAVADVDCCWLPYLEVDQDSSGIASISFDVARRVVASNSFAFDETLRLIPYEGIERFDIGNHVELAEKTLRPGGPIRRPTSAYSLESQARLYVRCAGLTPDAG